MCQLLRRVVLALVLLVAISPTPSCGQAMAYNSPPCIQGQYSYSTGLWPCYLYYVNYPFLHQVHVDQITQTEEGLQSQENVTSVETQPENNTTVTVQQEITTSVGPQPEDNCTCPLEVVAELQSQLGDQARQMDFQKNQQHLLVVVMGKVLQLLSEIHGDHIYHAADHIHHAEDHARPWKSKNNQLQILAAAVGKALNTLYETQAENEAKTGVMQEEVDALQKQMRNVQQAVLLMAFTLERRAAHPEPSMTHFNHEHLEHVEDHADPLENHENQLQILIASMGKALHILHEIQEENDAQTDLLKQEAYQQQDQTQSPEPEPAANPTTSSTTQINQDNDSQKDLMRQEVDQLKEHIESLQEAVKLLETQKGGDTTNSTVPDMTQVDQDDQQLEEKVNQQAVQMQNQERELGELKLHQQRQEAQIRTLLQSLLETAEENKRLEEKVEQQAMQMQNQINQIHQQRDRLHDLDDEVHSLRETLNERKQAVAFSVRFSSWTTVNVVAGGGYADTLKYNETITNIGNGYDPSTGLFTAPSAGLYAFFFSHHSSVYGWVTLGIFHGDRNIAASALNGQGVSYDKGSGFGTVHLTKGEIVNVRLMGTSKERSLSYVEVGPFTTFSGMLVAAV